MNQRLLITFTDDKKEEQTFIVLWHRDTGMDRDGQMIDGKAVIAVCLFASPDGSDSASLGQTVTLTINMEVWNAGTRLVNQPHAKKGATGYVAQG